VADGWCWFVLREEYCWLVAGGWFVLREKYCWLVADKPSEQSDEFAISYKLFALETILYYLFLFPPFHLTETLMPSRLRACIFGCRFFKVVKNC
jgi:hypothetical protein